MDEFAKLEDSPAAVGDNLQVGDRAIYYDKAARLPIPATINEVFSSQIDGEMVVTHYAIDCDSDCAPHPMNGRSIPVQPNELVGQSKQEMRKYMLWNHEEAGTGFGVCAISNQILWNEQRPTKTKPDWPSIVCVCSPRIKYTWEEIEHLFKFSIRQTASYDQLFNIRMGANLIVIDKYDQQNWMRKRMSWEYGPMHSVDLFQAMNVFDRGIRSTGRYDKNGAKLCYGDLIETADGWRGHIRGDRNKRYIEYIDGCEPKPNAIAFTSEVAKTCTLIDDYCYEQYGVPRPQEEPANE